MRILQIVHQYPPQNIGGVELLTHNLAVDLAEYGHDVTVLTRASQPTDTKIDGVRVLALQDHGPTRRFVNTFSDAATVRWFDEFVRREKFGVAHIQHLMGFPTQMIESMKNARVPFVVTLHDYWYACANAQRITNFDASVCDTAQPEKCGRCAAARANLPKTLRNIAGPLTAPLFTERRRLLRRVLQNAADVSAPSHVVIDWFHEQGEDTSRWRVMPYGIDLPQPYSRPSADTAGLRVTYIGGLAWQKGIHVLIDAFNRMPHDTRLTIAGPLENYPEYVAQLRAAAVHPKITFVGKIDRNAVWELLSKTDVLIAPSLWPETFMLTVHEAIAAGCHVITSDLGAQAEAARAADEMVVPANDADALLQAMLHTHPAPQQPAYRQIRTGRHYAAEYAALYESITNNHA
ncbi:MAG: glycosyltransferase [Chloroflexi bacterium]|nr:glycosyltransferase [Chloroflexota bacterium]